MLNKEVLKAGNLEFSDGRRVILSSINFSVNQGEICGLQ